MQAPLKEKNDIKIFILYLLKNIGYPLDFNTISDIVIQDEFVNYFDFAECFAELLDSGIIETIKGSEMESTTNVAGAFSTQKSADMYHITENGVGVVEQLQSSLLNVIKDKSLKSAMRLLSFKARGSDIKCVGAPRDDGRFDLHCEVIENHETLLSLDIVLNDKHQLDRMMYNFNERPEIVYRGVITLLTGDINYLID